MPDACYLPKFLSSIIYCLDGGRNGGIRNTLIWKPEKPKPFSKAYCLSDTISLENCNWLKQYTDIGTKGHRLLYPDTSIAILKQICADNTYCLKLYDELHQSEDK